MSHIDRNDTYIEWNEKGEVAIDGDLIPSSQIIDLIKCCFYPYKNFTPECLEQLFAAMHSYDEDIIEQNYTFLVQNIPTLQFYFICAKLEF